jgi:hypothetical protein
MQKVKDCFKKIEKMDVIIFLIPFITFLILLCIYYPGILTCDSYNQLSQIDNGIYNNAHPIFHTFIEWLCLSIWDSPASIAILQVTVFSIIWTVICKYNRKIESKKLKILQIILTLFIALNPMNSIHSITLWKDILYSYSILLFCFLMQICIDKRFKLSLFDVIKLSFMIILVKNLRHNGITITLGMGLLLTIILMIKDFRSFNFIKLIVFCIIMNYIFSIPLTAFNVEKGNVLDGGVTDLKLTQLTGAYLNCNCFTEDQLKELATFIDIAKLKALYNPYFNDPIHNVITDTDKFKKNKKEFYNILLDTALRNKKQTLIFAYKTNAIILAMDMPNDSIGTILNTNIDAQNKDENINHIFKNTEIYQKTDKLITTSVRTKPFNLILYNPAFYMYIGIFIALYLTFKGMKYAYLMIFPNLASIAGLMITMPVQDARYVYANFLVTYLVMAILIGYNLVKKAKGSEVQIKKLEKLDKNCKVLIIIPAYNESENILETYNSIMDYNKKHKTKYDVIVINDGSKDNTGIICEQNNIPIINLIHNLGIGGAVQTGYKYAHDNNYDIAIQFDGDGQHDIESVKDLIKPIIDGQAEFVIGSRFVSKMNNFKSSKARRIGISIISSVIKMITGKKIFDTTSGFRACNREIISSFASHYPTEYPEPVTTVEMLKLGYIIDEVPAKMKERIGGTSSIKSIKNVYYMINVILSIIVVGMRRYK